MNLREHGKILFLSFIIALESCLSLQLSVVQQKGHLVLYKELKHRLGLRLNSNLHREFK